ncbi:MAG: outer membrane lipoprotein carrier protein LolA [Bacteroidales bacterium]|nr:outer membrane lipoprotein carrier protein LolA [Bacteroidales bacterium]
MRRCLFSIIILLLTGIIAFGQNVTVDDIIAANKPEQFSAAFVQTKHSSLLKDNLVSKGSIVLTKPGKIHIEMTAPEAKVSDYDSFEEMKGFGRRSPSEKDFDITLLEGDGYILKMIPRRSALRQAFTQIVVYVNVNTLIVNKIIVYSRGGDVTTLEFSDIKTVK